MKDAGKKMENIKRMEQKTEEKCEVCGSPLLLKWGKFGTFYACSAYNKKDPTSCTFTKENIAAKPDLNTPEAQEAGDTEEYCEQLRQGDGDAARGQCLYLPWRLFERPPPPDRRGVVKLRYGCTCLRVFVGPSGNWQWTGRTAHAPPNT